MLQWKYKQVHQPYIAGRAMAPTQNINKFTLHNTKYTQIRNRLISSYEQRQSITDTYWDKDSNITDRQI